MGRRAHAVPRMASICTAALCAGASGRPTRRQAAASFVPRHHHHRDRLHRHRSARASSPSSSSPDRRPRALLAAWLDDHRDDDDPGRGPPPPRGAPPVAIIDDDEDYDHDCDEYDDERHRRRYSDDEKFDSFERAIEAIASKKNVVRDFRKNADDLIVVKSHMLDRARKLPRWDVSRLISPPLPAGSSSSSSSSSRGTAATNTNDAGTDDDDDDGARPTSYARRKIRERCDAFLERTGFTQSQHRLASVLLAHLADDCARRSDPGPIRVAWEKILEAGLVPLSRTLSTYLYVLGLEGEEKGEVDWKGGGVRRDVAAEVAMYHDALYLPTEKTITLLVKSLVSRGDASGAEALLDGITPDGPLGQLLRHRTTSPILRLYCDVGDIDSALRLYRRMRDTSRVKMDASTYADFIAAVARNGYFRPDSDRVLLSAGAEDVMGHYDGRRSVRGPELLNSLVSEMAEDVLDISEASAAALRDGFAIGFAGCGIDPTTTTTTTTTTQTMPSTTTRRDDRTLVADRVTIDEETAACPATGATLRLIVLEDAQRTHLHDALLGMARMKSMEYTAKLAAKGRSTNDNAEKAELATQILKDFSAWLDARDGPPYTAIVDGANVAYFGWGRVNVYQLVHMVKALEELGEYPLVVFPQKYTNQRFHLRQGMMQVLRDEELEFLERLKEKGQMYVVPPMCLDDLYWMLASVSNQTVSTAGRNIDVPPDNPDGRYPGLRPMVISNDKMRDHRMDLLEERSFRRWCTSHIVNYNFTEFVENSREERTISFRASDLFSDEIQGNACPGGGDGNVTMAWHFPTAPGRATADRHRDGTSQMSGGRSGATDGGSTKSSALDSEEGNAISPTTRERSNEAAPPSMETLKLLALGGCPRPERRRDDDNKDFEEDEEALDSRGRHRRSRWAARGPRSDVVDDGATTFPHEGAKGMTRRRNCRWRRRTPWRSSSHDHFEVRRAIETNYFVAVESRRGSSSRKAGGWSVDAPHTSGKATLTRHPESSQDATQTSSGSAAVPLLGDAGSRGPTCVDDCLTAFPHRGK
ncbi:hypothetical protein ACHAW5_000603 [Stephanodiscus triporus]|uniref:Uncharacterized protein n=1 Tax=Stephanodiscus triporus TaxID=2934178 RepID=A0ABD3PBJ1_9STRA